MPSCRDIPDVSHFGQSELGSISIKLVKKLWNRLFSPVKCISMLESGYMHNLLKTILRKLQAVAFKFLVCLFL